MVSKIDIPFTKEKLKEYVSSNPSHMQKIYPFINSLDSKFFDGCHVDEDVHENFLSFLENSHI